MREILFKAKSITTGKWLEGSLMYNEDAEEGWEAIIIPCDCNFYAKNDGTGDIGIEDWYRVDKDTICQYTGLTDKNGNKIWENDILFDDENTSLVRWDESVARFVIDDYGTKGCVMEYGFDEDAGDYGVVDTNGFDDFCDDTHMIFKVIGNIFDNPELLGVATMTIDEAISKYRNRVEQYKDWENMKDIAEEHEQLAEWLEELKAIKNWKTDIMEDFCRYDASSFDEIVKNTRNKAIDDVVKALIPRLTDAIYQKDVEGMRNLINDVAEQLKAGIEE